MRLDFWDRGTCSAWVEGVGGFLFVAAVGLGEADAFDLGNRHGIRQGLPSDGQPYRLDNL